MKDELQIFEAKLEKEHTRGLWKDIPAEQPGESREPHSVAQFHIWRWAQMCQLLEEAIRAVKIDHASQRRVLQLRNPGLSRGTTHTLSGCLQILGAGETAPTHRHTVAAIRFIIKGDGAYTVVDGEKLAMKEGDLVLTPTMMWHDYGSDARNSVIWFDGLDSPFIGALNLTFFDAYPQTKQPLTKPEAFTTKRLGVSALRPPRAGATPNFGLPIIYPWKDTYDMLKRLAGLEGSGDPYDGIILDYLNPLTGGPTLPTISCQIQMLRSGEETRIHRHTTSAVYHVFRGTGSLVVGDEKLEWQQGDTFAMPAWVWHGFANRTREEAILFSINDRPILDPHGLYREESER